MTLDDADFPAPSLLAGVPRLAIEWLAAEEAEMAKGWQQELTGGIAGQPQLLSLQRANVAGLGLINVSVADCRFAGAHNLDKLRLEAGVAFGIAPTRLVPPSWGSRQVIAEERAWRAARSRRWTAPPWPPWLDEQQPDELQAGSIAGLYRALRKGREDTKDEPGAADFYYGKMEMRRCARPTEGGSDGRSTGTSRGRFERGVLTAYWLVSGYGLRTWRAVACLAVVIAVLAIAFHLAGFAKPPQPVSYWTSLLYTFRATLSLTDNEVTLTAWGKLLQGLLRLTGPRAARLGPAGPSRPSEALNESLSAGVRDVPGAENDRFSAPAAGASGSPSWSASPAGAASFRYVDHHPTGSDRRRSTRTTEATHMRGRQHGLHGTNHGMKAGCE
ncbi:hypothetical protein AB0E63_43145 [Kribbella sp. NPDC026596]|uniref:hypothetical protein n=1 Tax=Kribbella sp. NPDC026596 TaxID=3155122 RepID=UPI0033C4E3D3